MQKKLITVLAVPLIAALTAQAAAGSERHHRQAKGRAVASEQLLNSNAYGASVEWPEPCVDTYQGPVYEGEYMAPTANGG